MTSEYNNLTVKCSGRLHEMTIKTMLKRVDFTWINEVNDFF